MMNDWRPTRSGVTHTFAWPTLLLTAVLLQACGQGDTAAGSRLRVYAVDLSGGAKSCDVPKIKPVSGQTSEAAIKLGNDGGWCGLPVYQSGPKPFDAGLLVQRPSHGIVLIHAVGDETRIDYTPDHGFAGTDGFTVKLVPGSEVIHVAATVTAPVVAAVTAPVK
jgi:hypothetical protein